MNPSKTFFYFLFFLFFAVNLNAQNSSDNQRRFTINNSEFHTIKSDITGAEYELMIHLPYLYSQDTSKHYPVVYFCDGFYDFALFSSIYGSQVWDKTIPECLLVGFSYKGENPDYGKLRRYDYSPTRQEGDSAGISGGAPDFLKVVENEFIPFIEKNYRVDTSFRALGGSSMGGLFTLYAMFTRTDLFDAYMSVSPAASWDNNYLLRLEEEYHKTHDGLPVTLFMSMAEFDLPWVNGFMDGIIKMNESFEKSDYKNFRYWYKFVDYAHHSGTKPEAYSRAMKYIFEPLVKKDLSGN